MRTILLFLTVIIMSTSCNSNVGQNQDTNTGSTEIFKEYSDAELATLHKKMGEEYEKLRPKVVMPAEGYFNYPYLIPAGFYKQMWDWDAFFMGNHFLSVGEPQYLKYWALNLLEGVDEKGYVSGCATVKGPRPIFGDFSMKPFLSQGVYSSAVALDDFVWVKENYDLLKRVINYREQTQQDKETGLFFWQNAMQSGADNNVAMNYFPTEDTRSFLSCDASGFQLKEYVAQAAIAKRLGNVEDEKLYTQKAEALKVAINKYLWNDTDKTYYNVDRETGEHYKRISYSNFVPLIAGTLSQENGKAMISKYLISADHMKAKFGYRTLSLQDPDYNNKNIIVPFSNWQGPVWPIANYIYSIGLKKYGFEEELKWQAGTLGELLLADIAKYGTMHENYHADTGAPLAPDHSYVDEDGNIIGFISWNLCIWNILDGLVNGNWMLLDTE